MFNLGMSEIVLILVVALVFLGPRKLPELASGIGKMIREVRKATADIKSEIELDETIRKPLEELREATMLPPEELKRRDLERKMRDEYDREERERQEREEQENQARADQEARDLAEKEQAPPTPEPVSVSSDKTIAMPSPFTAVSPSDTMASPPPGAPVVAMPPRTVPVRRSTDPGVGLPAGSAKPPAPPPPPLPPGLQAGKLPPPPSPGARSVPLPPPPVKKV